MKIMEIEEQLAPSSKVSVFEYGGEEVELVK